MSVIIVGIDEIEIFRCYKADGLVFARFVFLLRIDIGVAVEYGGMYAVGQHTFDDSRRTGGAAGVKQHAVVAVGSLEFEHSHGLEAGIVGLSVSLGQRYGEKCSVCIYLGRNLVSLS